MNDDDECPYEEMTGKIDVIDRKMMETIKSCTNFLPASKKNQKYAQTKKNLKRHYKMLSTIFS